MNRPFLSLLAVVVALTALTGLAAVTGGDGGGEPTTPDQTTSSPVQRSELVCPQPASTDDATTSYTAFTPGAGDTEREAAGGDDAGTAGLLPAPEYAPGVGDDGADAEQRPGDGSGSDDEAEQVAPLNEPGVPVGATTRDADAPALTGVADGALAPGWTVGQTTRIESGSATALMGASCQRPDTDFWFAGASTAESRHDYVHLTNPEAATTVVDIELYGPDGPVDAEAGQGITVPAGSAAPLLLSTLTSAEEDNLAVHVTARTGRIGAQVEAVDDERGADWIAPVAGPGPGPLVLPGIPADAREVRLVAFTPGDEDVTLDLGLAGPSGTIIPAGHETVSVLSGVVTTVELGELTHGDAGSLVLTPAAGSGTGFVAAAVEVTRGEKGDDGARELAFIPATMPVGRRATLAGGTADGTELYLTAPSGAAEAEVTLSPGTDGGEPVTESYTVEKGATLTISPEVPKETEGDYAVTVTTSGAPLYAAGMISEEEDGDAPLFTVQTFSDDHSTVTVPTTEQDLTILTR